MNASALSARIRQYRQRGSSRPGRHPEALRREIVSHAQSRRSGGESIEAVAKSLGMSPFTLYEWLRGGATPGRRRDFRRVHRSPNASRATLVSW